MRVLSVCVSVVIPGVGNGKVISPFARGSYPVIYTHCTPGGTAIVLGRLPSLIRTARDGNILFSYLFH